MRFILILTVLSLFSCSTKDLHAPIAQPELPGLGSKHSTQMTSQECSQAGGVVVGDIGDGRIHRSDFLCKNGDVPLGSIVASQGESTSVEGSVCCGL